MEVKSGKLEKRQREILGRLHGMIDSKFNRTDRSKRIEPFMLKLKMTAWSMSKEFEDVEPGELAVLFKSMVANG